MSIQRNAVGLAVSNSSSMRIIWKAFSRGKHTLNVETESLKTLSLKSQNTPCLCSPATCFLTSFFLFENARTVTLFHLLSLNRKVVVAVNSRLPFMANANHLPGLP